MRPFRFSSLPLTIGKRIFEHEHISLAHFNPSTKQFEHRARSQNSNSVTTRVIRTKSLTDAKYFKQEMDCPIYFKLQEQEYLYAALPSDVIEITDEIYNSAEPLTLSLTLYHITTEAAIKYYQQNGFIYRNHLSAPNIEPIYFQRAYPTSDRYVLEIDLTNPTLYMKDDITTQYRFFKHKDKDDIFTYEDIDPLFININIK